MSGEVHLRRLSDRSSRQLGSLRKSDSAGEPVFTSLRLHIICVVVCLLSAYIFTLTEHDDHQHTIWCAFEIILQTILVVVGTAYFRMRIRLLHESNVIMPLLVMIACLSLICEPFQRLLFGTGHAFEMLIMHSQCNLMLALAVCGFRMSYQRLAVIIAVFMTVFCCTISSAQGLIPLTIVFAISSICWLVASWWETVDRRLLATDQRGLPKWWLVAACLPGVALLSSGAFGSNSVTNALRGFMPSSGGSGEYSPFSRGGVNDGDALVAGSENIKSFASIEDAPFLDSDKPSLYDVFNDTFDEPPKLNGKQQRAVALPADLMKHIHQMMAEARQAGREFSLIRNEQKSDSERIRDLQTHALFFVAGRTPLHLRMEVYELFDGVTWTPIECEDLLGLAMKKTEDRHWLNIPQPGQGFGVYSGTATHSIKIANLDGNRLPVPPHLVGVSIDKVDRADMYEAFDNGLVALRRDSIPTMTPVNFVSRCIDQRELRDSEYISIIRRNKVKTASDLCIALPVGGQIPQIRTLAEKCVAGIPRGWAQVAAVVQHLRANYAVDRTVKVSPDSVSPLGDFLFETKCGPEYLFAGSAAVMLRSLGYSTRLVSGFYAHPEKYDERSQHTPVHAADAHFWCEVSIGANTWLTIEPSPGYHVLTPPAGVLEQFILLLKSLWLFALQNIVRLALVIAAVVIVFVNRAILQDVLLTLRWKLNSRASLKRRAIQLAVLVDHRLRLAGLERKSGTTLRRWSGHAALESVRDTIIRVADVADQAAFSPVFDSQFEGEELNVLASGLSLRQLIRLQKKTGQAPDAAQVA